MSLYAKFIVAATAALGVAATALADGRLTAAEIVGIAIAAVGALGVRQIPNKPPNPGV
ncbi:MAG TPA: hypothetical protein VFZ00_02845 [Solirubrobacter sp.]|nr:hypothetical protein [Solirubrobacter sp.]